MLRLLTKKLKNQSLNEIKPDEQPKVNTNALLGIGHFQDVSDKLHVQIDRILIQRREDLEEDTEETEQEHEERDQKPEDDKCLSENKENIVCVIDNTITQKHVNNNNNETQVNRNSAKNGDECTINQTISIRNSPPSAFHVCSHEIELIKRPTGEKRKFSKASLCQYKCAKVLPVPTYHGDSSSDEEIKELYSKHKCKTSNGPVINSTINGSRKIVCLNKVEAPRPSLNFDKMQQTGKKKSRPRVVKLKELPSWNTKELNDLVTFKPISLLGTNNFTPSSISNTFSSNILVPVEEPLQSGFAY